MRSDQDLVRAWQGGDRKAGNELLQRHFGAIHRFFANKVDHEIEELAQDTFVRCVEAYERYEGRSSFRTFLFAVANNVLREWFRKKNRHQPIDFETQSVVDMGAGPSSILVGRREQRALLEALRRIPVEFQVVLELYYWERMSGLQLGEILEIPEPTAYSRVRRAKHLLKKSLARLQASPIVLQSTVTDLDRWAAQVRAKLGADDGTLAPS